MEERGQGGWLPPDPGERPEVEPRPGGEPAPDPAPAQEEAEPQGEQQPPTQQQWGPPPPGWQQQPPPGWYPPPPQPPPGYWWPQPSWPRPGDDPNDPGNGSAIASFVLSVSGIGLLVILFGISAPITIVLGGLGIWFGVKGKQAVDGGKTKKHRNLAQAGFVIGIATVILSILAIVGWTLLLTLDEDILDELDEDQDRNFDDFDSIRAAVLTARAALALLA